MVKAATATASTMALSKSRSSQRKKNTSHSVSPSVIEKVVPDRSKAVQTFEAALRIFQQRFRTYKALRLLRLHARREEEEFEAAVRLQRNCRRVIERCRFIRLRGKATKIQAWFRGCMVRVVRGIDMDKFRAMAIRIQAVVRGRFHRLRARVERISLMERLRRHLILLWHLANTSIVYRSKFWTMIGSTSILSVAIHEAEVERLWHQLGVFELSGVEPGVNEGNRFMPMLDRAEDILRASDGGSQETFNMSKTKWSKVKAQRKKTYGIEAGKRRDQQKVVDPSSPWLSQASHEAARTHLIRERTVLYAHMRKEDNEARRAAFFKAFEIENKKYRKRLLAQSIWNKDIILQKPEADLASVSADVVLSIIDNVTLSGAQFADVKLDQRIRADVLHTVQACLTSIQKLQERKDEEKRRGGAEERLRRAVSCDVYVDGH